jgi:hypothetical protein
MSTIRGTQRQTTGTKKTRAPEDDSGLCSTCIYTPACVNAARAKHPVMYCEEFNCEMISSLRGAESQFTLKPRPKRKSEKASNTVPELKGLCINCDNRKVCTHTKPEGGIWHCEEYR